MSNRRFRLVDVFADGPLTGNPLAVVVDAEGLSTDEMLDITRWLGFSETTFLGDPKDPAADYSVRIFTLSGELPFAGHPTLGTAWTWSQLNEGSSEVIQECGAGLVRVRLEDGGASFSAPPLIRDGPVEEAHLARVAAVLGVSRPEITAAKWVDNGPGWLGVRLADADRVLEVTPDVTGYDGTWPLEIGVFGDHSEGSEFAYEVRAFFTGERQQLREDPVTGSLNASLAQWVIKEGWHQPPFEARQGTALGRKGRVRIASDAESNVWVGGSVVQLVDGVIDI